MKSDHEIRESLPAYLKGSLPEKEMEMVSAHLLECDECRVEAAVLEELLGVEPPDPGELFWGALPRRVRLSVEGRKRRFFPVSSLGFRGLSAAAAVFAVLLLILFSYRQTGFNDMPSGDSPFHDPLAASLSDYSGLTEGDIPPIQGELKDFASYLQQVDPLEESYRSDVASLSMGEIDKVNEALKEAERNKG